MARSRISASICSSSALPRLVGKTERTSRLCNASAKEMGALNSIDALRFKFACWRRDARSAGGGLHVVGCFGIARFGDRDFAFRDALQIFLRSVDERPHVLRKKKTGQTRLHRLD